MNPPQTDLLVVVGEAARWIDPFREQKVFVVGFAEMPLAVREVDQQDDHREIPLDGLSRDVDECRTILPGADEKPIVHPQLADRWVDISEDLEVPSKGHAVFFRRPQVLHKQVGHDVR